MVFLDGGVLSLLLRVNFAVEPNVLLREGIGAEEAHVLLGVSLHFCPRSAMMYQLDCFPFLHGREIRCPPLRTPSSVSTTTLILFVVPNAPAVSATVTAAPKLYAPLERESFQLNIDK